MSTRAITNKPKQAYKKREQNVHAAICVYLKLNYKNAIFHSDASGMRLTIGQAVALKKTRSHDRIPDLFIAEPIGNFSGLYLEIKKSKEELYTKKGDIKKNAHFEEQKETLKALNKRGYLALFAAGFDHGKEIIDAYFELQEDYLLQIWKHQFAD